ncbi:conserved hypothetical protein [Ricinus communis]|uniref:Uncharacterized protein n=1 Tax=Ricinus communis TaxID=3988 RepID=B9SNQ5_RICCO|nr:conserved hypothetical protein [Ricinus communis]
MQRLHKGLADTAWRIHGAFIGSDHRTLIIVLDTNIKPPKRCSALKQMDGTEGIQECGVKPSVNGIKELMLILPVPLMRLNCSLIKCKVCPIEEIKNKEEALLKELNLCWKMEKIH